MKFCKNLQRVVDISDPEWAPYWTNYKMLKKLIKELPSLVPTEDGRFVRRVVRPDSPTASVDSSVTSGSAAMRQPHGDQSTEGIRPAAAARFVSGNNNNSNNNTSTSATDADATTVANNASINNATSTTTLQEQHGSPPNQVQPVATSKKTIGKSPGEIAFFKLLHTEFKKATHFFERAQQEFTIREERVREGMEIMKQPNSIMVDEKWSLLAKSIYRLYKDLLLLETFAIMTYCSFSKILKKHDKVTGYDTRNAFMANVVNKANFTNYPRVMEMISRCERLYEEVSAHLLREGKEGLYEDERLFINMIHRLNEQVSDTAESEGAERKEPPAGRRKAPGISNMPKSGKSESDSSRALRGLVEEIEQKNLAAQVSEGQAGIEEDDADSDEDGVATTSATATSSKPSASQQQQKRSTSSTSAPIAVKRQRQEKAGAK